MTVNLKPEIISQGDRELIVNMTILACEQGSTWCTGSLFGEKNSEEREVSSLLDQRPVHMLDNISNVRRDLSVLFTTPQTSKRIC